MFVNLRSNAPDVINTLAVPLLQAGIRYIPKFYIPKISLRDVLEKETVHHRNPLFYNHFESFPINVNYQKT
jgi:hypothetical protein